MECVSAHWHAWNGYPEFWPMAVYDATADPDLAYASNYEVLPWTGRDGSGALAFLPHPAVRNPLRAVKKLSPARASLHVINILIIIIIIIFSSPEPAGAVPPPALGPC